MVLHCTPNQETLISLLYNISLAQGIILSSSFSLSSAYFSCYEDILLCPFCRKISYAFRVLYGPTLILTKNLSRMTNNFSWSFHMGSIKSWTDGSIEKGCHRDRKQEHGDGNWMGIDLSAKTKQL